MAGTLKALLNDALHYLVSQLKKLKLAKNATKNLRTKYCVKI